MPEQFSPDTPQGDADPAGPADPASPEQVSSLGALPSESSRPSQAEPGKSLASRLGSYLSRSLPTPARCHTWQGQSAASGGHRAPADCNVDINEQLATQDDVARVTFQPGPLGLEGTPVGRAEQVSWVDPARQGAALGVQVGWKWSTVNGQPATATAIAACARGRQPWTATFKQAAPIDDAVAEAAETAAPEAAAAPETPSCRFLQNLGVEVLGTLNEAILAEASGRSGFQELTAPAEAGAVVPSAPPVDAPGQLASEQEEGDALEGGEIGAHATDETCPYAAPDSILETVSSAEQTVAEGEAVGDQISTETATGGIAVDDALGAGESATASTASIPEPSHDDGRLVKKAIAEEEKTAREEAAAPEAEESEWARILRCQQKAQGLPPEPVAGAEGVVQLLLRLPDGTRLQRRFLRDGSCQHVLDWVESEPSARVRTGHFSVVQKWPGHFQEFGSAQAGQTLEAAGLRARQEALFLQREGEEQAPVDAQSSYGLPPSADRASVSMLLEDENGDNVSFDPYSLADIDPYLLQPASVLSPEAEDLTCESDPYYESAKAVAAWEPSAKAKRGRPVSKGDGYARKRACKRDMQLRRAATRHRGRNAISTSA